MSIFKPGRVYGFRFIFNGERVQESARTGNAKAARKIDSAYRLRLARGESGIVERPQPPTLTEFGPQFEAHIVTDCADKPAAVGFYREKLRRLLHDEQLAGARLDENGKRIHMPIAGHGSVTTLQRHVHPTPEGLERAFQRLEELNAQEFEQAEAGAKAEATGTVEVATKMATLEKSRSAKNGISILQ